MMKHIQSNTNNFSIRNDGVQKYILLRNSFLDVMGIECDANKCRIPNSNITAGIVRLNSNNLCGSVTAWRLYSPSKPTKRLDFVRRFTCDMIYICDKSSSAREGLVEVFHCAVLDVSAIAIELMIQPIAQEFKQKHPNLLRSVNKSLHVKFLKRALMDLFVLVRGVVTDISKECKDPHFSVMAYQLVPTLCKVVLMLTQFRNHFQNLKDLCTENVCLGDTITNSLLSFFKRFLRSREELGMTKGLIQCWMSQLASQERINPSVFGLDPNRSHDMPSPARAFSQPSILGGSGESMIESVDLVSEDGCLKGRGGWEVDCECSLCVGVRRTFSTIRKQKTTSNNGTKPLHEQKADVFEMVAKAPQLNEKQKATLRYEGCVFMDKLLRRVCRDRESDRHQKVFFLSSYYCFHYMVENGQYLKEHLISMVVSSILLAGKEEDFLVQIPRLLRLSQEIKRSYANYSIGVSQDDEESKRIAPASSVLIQAYEFQLLSLFGFHVEASASHPSAYVDEFAKELHFEEKETYELENLILDTDFTHSSLCLLDEPKLILAAICLKMKERNYRDNIRDLSSLLGMEFSSEWRVKTFHNFMVKVGIYSETLKASNRLLDKSLDMIPPCIKGMLRDIYKVEKKLKNANMVVRSSPKVSTSLLSPCELYSGTNGNLENSDEPFAKHNCLTSSQNVSPPNDCPDTIISAVSNNEHSRIDSIESNLTTEEGVHSSNGYLQDAGSADTNACQDLLSSTRQAVVGKSEDIRMDVKHKCLPEDLAMTCEKGSCLSFIMSGLNKRMKSSKDVLNFMMQSRINTSKISLEGNGQALISFSTIDDREKAFSKYQGKTFLGQTIHFVQGPTATESARDRDHQIGGYNPNENIDFIKLRDELSEKVNHNVPVGRSVLDENVCGIFLHEPNSNGNNAKDSKLSTNCNRERNPCVAKRKIDEICNSKMPWSGNQGDDRFVRSRPPSPNCERRLNSRNHVGPSHGTQSAKQATGLPLDRRQDKKRNHWQNFRIGNANRGSVASGCSRPHKDWGYYGPNSQHNRSNGQVDNVRGYGGFRHQNGFFKRQKQRNGHRNNNRIPQNRICKPFLRQQNPHHERGVGKEEGEV